MDHSVYKTDNLPLTFQGILKTALYLYSSFHRVGGPQPILGQKSNLTLERGSQIEPSGALSLMILSARKGFYFPPNPSYLKEGALLPASHSASLDRDVPMSCMTHTTENITLPRTTSCSHMTQLWIISKRHRSDMYIKS